MIVIIQLLNQVTWKDMFELSILLKGLSSVMSVIIQLLKQVTWKNMYKLSTLLKGLSSVMSVIIQLLKQVNWKDMYKLSTLMKGIKRVMTDNSATRSFILKNKIKALFPFWRNLCSLVLQYR